MDSYVQMPKWSKIADEAWRSRKRTASPRDWGDRLNRLLGDATRGGSAGETAVFQSSLNCRRSVSSLSTVDTGSDATMEDAKTPNSERVKPMGGRRRGDLVMDGVWRLDPPSVSAKDRTEYMQSDVLTSIR